jgi:hypothetical protein
MNFSIASMDLGSWQVGAGEVFIMPVAGAATETIVAQYSLQFCGSGLTEHARTVSAREEAAHTTALVAYDRRPNAEA